MPGRVTRQGWTSQPQYPVPIDWENPDTRDLRFLVIGSMPVDLVTGQVGAVGSGISQQTRYSGQGAMVAPSFTSGGGIVFADRPSYGITSDITVFTQSLFRNTVGGVDDSIVSKALSNGATQNAFGLVRSGTDFAYQISRAGAGGYRVWRVDAVGAPFNLMYAFSFSWGGDMSATPTAYQNGKLHTSGFTSIFGGTGSGIATSPAKPVCIGLRDDGVAFDGLEEVTAIWARQLSAEEHARVTRNPYSLLKPVRRRIYTIGAASAGITATSASTLNATTGTASAAVRVTGSSALTLSQLTGTASTAVRVTGTSAITLAQLTGTASTAVRVTGTSSATLAALAGTSSTAVSISGTSAITLGGLLTSANGIVGAAPAIGTSTITLAAFSGSSSAAVRVTATAAIDLSAVSGSASGALGVAPRLGTSNAALAQFIGFTVGAVTGTPVINTAGAITGGRSSYSMSRPKQSAMRRPRMN